MAEQVLTQAELEGERELERLLASGELESASFTAPKAADDDGGEDAPAKPAAAPETDAPAKPADAPAEAPTDTPPAEKPADAPTDTPPVEQPAAPDVSAIEAQLAAEQQALLKLTQDRMALEEKNKALASEYSGINPALDALSDKLDAGEIMQGEYDKQKRALEQKREDLRRQYDANHGLMGEIAANEQQASAKIQGLESQKDPLTIAVNSFLSRPENAVYNDDANARALGNLYQTLKSLPRFAGKSDAELIAIADKQFRTMNDIPAATEKKAAPPTETPEQKAARLAKNIPIGTSNMPPVVTNTGSNQYTDLASKSGPEIEAAFAKMSAAEQEEFLSKLN